MAGAAAAVDAAAAATAESSGRSGAPALVEARPQALLIALLRIVLSAAGLAGFGALSLLVSFYEPGPQERVFESPR